MPAAYVGDINSLFWNFISFPHKPSYSASFLHWIFWPSYPHLTTLYIFYSIVSWSPKPSPLRNPWLRRGWTLAQKMLAIWFLVPLPFLKPAWISGSSSFTYCWSLAWRILSITLLACEIVQLCGSLSILGHCLSLGSEWKLTFSSPLATAEFSKFAGGASGKESTCQCRRCTGMVLVPGSGRSPGVGNGNPLQYSCLENSMDRGAWQTTVHGVTKSWTRPSMHGEEQMRVDWGCVRLHQLGISDLK